MCCIKLIFCVQEVDILCITKVSLLFIKACLLWVLCIICDKSRFMVTVSGR